MIGLGSNRLSVCRRGGMRVTQAGRGGMEWLLGGRGALGASPYSAQATAALKDAFTAAQWQTIRDYGFAHPDFVTMANAYPVGSATALLYYTKCDYIGATSTGAYINPNITIGVDSALEVKFMITGASVAGVHTDVIGYSGSGGNFLIRRDSRSGQYDIWKTSGTSYGKRYGFALDTAYEVSLNIEGRNEAIVDGTEVGTITSNSTPTYNAFIMATYGISGGAAYASGNQRIYYAKIYDNVTELARYMFPCYHKTSGEIGLFDIVNGVFYPNAGSGSLIKGDDAEW